jgi:RNA-directed DNA polymerase
LDKAKSFRISKWTVWEAYKRVKANHGTYGVDRQSVEDFERDLKGNLYKIWNRMSSGSYMPPPVRRVDIPKGDGRTRPLGIPTVSDRIAQMVAKMQMEPEIEALFHRDSYGSRPGKSAHEAVGKARERCWKYDWVIDLDVVGFFDNVDHELLLRAVRKHTKEGWVILYVERWLKAPVQLPDGTINRRERGTPQGAVISPLLANLYLHYAFDAWMARKHPQIPFERYVDDAIVHCRSEAEAMKVKEAIAKRLNECKLELHPEKTKVVYCKDANRRKDAPVIQFDFLGFTFKPRKSRTRTGRTFLNFTPEISRKAKRRMAEEMRKMDIANRSGTTLQELAGSLNPVFRGWINYYGKYDKWGLAGIFMLANSHLSKWASRRHKKLKRSWHKGMAWLGRIARRSPDLFVHWGICKCVLG